MGDAIGYHSGKAAEFGHGHDLLSSGDHFASPFVYGRWRLRRVLAALIPAPSPGAALVDVGCGTGDELALFHQQGYDVTGVEPAEGMRAEAVLRHPELADRLLSGTAQAIPLQDGVADVVVNVEVLRYIPDLGPVAREVHRVLRVGGSWVFTVTPPTNWTFGPPLNWLRCKGVPLPYLQAVTQYWHRAAYLRSLLTREGFAVEGIVPASYLDFVSMVLCSLAPSLGRRWCKAWHPLWAFMEKKRLLPWAAGYYVVRAVRNG